MVALVGGLGHPEYSDLPTELPASTLGRGRLNPMTLTEYIESMHLLLDGFRHYWKGARQALAIDHEAAAESLFPDEMDACEWQDQFNTWRSIENYCEARECQEKTSKG
jgi:hypothetical protein